MYEQKTKITEAGQACRKCQTPVILQKRKESAGKGRNKIFGPFRQWYYTSWLMCPRCRTQYFNEDARVYITDEERMPLSADPRQQELFR